MLGLWPSKQQWKRWSLPSKLTAIGTAVSIIGILLSFLAPAISTFRGARGNPTPSVAELTTVNQIHSLMKDLAVKPAAIDLPKGGSSLLDQPEFVYAKHSILNLASLPGQTATATKVLRGYTAPGNLGPLRVLAVTILADLARLSIKQGIEIPESGFLQGLDLSDLKLQAQDFSHTDLHGSRIISADLSRAKFDAADMRDVLIERSTLDSALIGNSVLDNAKIKSSSLRGSLIVKTTLRQVLCRESSFENATIFSSIFDGSVFQSCSFHKANIVA